MIVKRTFTDDERIRRVWDVIDIKNLMGRWAYAEAYRCEGEALETLWVSQPENKKTASFGVNNGYYIGLDAIAAYIRGGSENDCAGFMRIHQLTHLPEPYKTFDDVTPYCAVKTLA